MRLRQGTNPNDKEEIMARKKRGVLGWIVVLGVVALVDRLEGAREAFEEADVQFHAVLTRDNLVPGKS